MADELAEHLIRASPREWQAPEAGRIPLTRLGACLVGGIALVWVGTAAFLSGVGADRVAAAYNALGPRGGVVLATAVLSVCLAAMLLLDRRTRTAQRAARRAAHARDLLSAVLNAFPAGMQIKDRDLRFVWVNDAHRIPIRFSASDLLGRTVADLDMNADLARQITADDRRVLETGQTVGPVEQLLLGPDAKQRNSILVTKAPLVQQGVVTHVITFAVEMPAWRQTRLQLDEARRLLETMMDAAPITILLADKDMRISWANRAFIDAFNLSEPPIGKTLAEAIPNPELLPEVIALNEDLFEGRRTLVQSEHHYPATADRPEHHLLAIKVPVRGPSGMVEQILTFGTDVTALKQAEAEAERANRLLAGVLDNVALKIQLKDRDLRYRWANRAFIETMTMDRTAVPGKTVADMRFSPEAKARFEAMDRAVLETGETIRFDDHWVDQGVEHVIEVIKAPIMDSDGHATHVLTIGDDVTEQRRLRTEAQTANRLVEGILRNAPLSIQIKDAALCYRWVNRTFTEWFALAPEEVLGLTLGELNMPPDATARTDENDRTVLATGRTLQSNERWPCGNGSYRDVMVVKAPMLDDDGHVTHVITIGTDISELNHLRVAAEEAQRRLQQVLDAVPVTIALKDPNRRFVWVNREFDRVLAGFNLPTVVGLQAEEAFPDEALASLVKQADDVLLKTGQEAAPIPQRLPGLGGEMRDYTVRRLAVRDAAGAIEGILVVGVDVTDLMRATNGLRQVNAELEERALERARELAKVNELVSAVLQSAPMPIVTLGLHGGYTSWNPAAEKLLGYTAAEALGGTMPPWPTPQQRGLSELLKVMAEGKSFSNVEVMRTRKGGGDVELLVSGAPLRNAEGTIEGAVAIGIDMTELRATARQLQQAQKMEAVGQLTGGIAHDFNNLLAVIIGALDLLVLEIPADGTAQMLVQQAIDAAERGADLTSHLLAFARRQALRPTATDVGLLVSEMTPLLHRTIGEAVIIRQTKERGLWSALVDRSQLESAILNLVGNARDAMPSGGTLTIDMRNDTVDRAEASVNPDLLPGEYVSVTVSDTGHGIASDIQGKVFEPFFTTKPVGQGTGLGLSMVLGFVKQSGGHLHLTSAPNEGTSVTLCLPRASGLTKRPLASNTVVSKTVVSQQGETILLVEDDPDMRRVSASTLAALGYLVLAVAGAATALEALEAHPEIALLLSDVVLGGTSTGFDLAREARRRRPELPVLFVSGFADPDAAARNPLDGSFDMLLKPFRREQLAAKLRAALGSVPHNAA
jgi:PAS domain S-box-containing protein